MQAPAWEEGQRQRRETPQMTDQAVSSSAVLLAFGTGLAVVSFLAS